MEIRKNIFLRENVDRFFMQRRAIQKKDASDQVWNLKKKSVKWNRNLDTLLMILYVVR